MLDSHPLLSSFQLMLLEHIIMCRLIMGNKSLAIQQVKPLERTSNVQLLNLYNKSLNQNATCDVQVWCIFLGVTDSSGLQWMPAAAATVCYTRRANTHNAGQRFGIFVLIHVHIYFMHYCISLWLTLKPAYCGEIENTTAYTATCVLQGLYAMSMNCMDAAEAQFKTALQVFKPLFASNVVCSFDFAQVHICCKHWKFPILWLN